MSEPTREEWEYRVMEQAAREMEKLFKREMEMREKAERHISELERERVAMATAILASQWYQPMSNSQGSCPFCFNYEDSGHDIDCIVLKIATARAAEEER